MRPTGTPTKADAKFPSQFEPTESSTNPMNEIDDFESKRSDNPSEQEMKDYQRIRDEQKSAYDCLWDNIEDILNVVMDGSMIHQEQCAE